jgi:hypothetical protein
VQTDFTLNRSSDYSRLTGNPSLLYLVGLAADPGLADTTRVNAAAGNSSQIGLDWRANAHTRIPLIFGSSLSTRISLADRRGNANGVITRTSEARFPDIDVDFGKLADAVRLTHFLLAPQLRTSWVHSTSSEYRGSTTDRTGRSTSDDFHPLLSMRGNLKNGTTTDLAVNVRNTLREVNQFGQSTQTDNNADLNLTVSRNYTQGQKVTFLGKTSTVKTNISVQLATVYSKHTGETHVAGSDAATRPINDTRLSVTGTGNYGFSSNVTGSAVLGFSQTRDNTLNIVHRSVRVELRAQFTF